MKNKKDIHYLSNNDFLTALIEHNLKRKQAELDSLPEPKLPNYIGECFIKIANGFARKPQYASYTFKDEMIGDAVENCIKYYRNFNSEISSNPFGYFTKCVWYSFLQRIWTEKTELYVKYKSIQQHGTNEGLLLQDLDEDDKLTYEETYGNIQEFIFKYEEVLKKKKEKKKLRGLEKFLEDHPVPDELELCIAEEDE